MNKWQINRDEHSITVPESCYTTEYMQSARDDYAVELAPGTYPLPDAPVSGFYLVRIPATRMYDSLDREHHAGESVNFTLPIAHYLLHDD